MDPKTLGRWSRQAWSLIPLLVAVMAMLWVADLRTVYVSPLLLTLLNFAFSTLVFLFIAVRVGRSFLANGEPALLLFGCGALVWGFGSVVASIVSSSDVNLTPAISNSCGWFSALCHLAGVVMQLRPGRPLRPTGSWLAGTYALCIACVGWIAVASLAGWMPVFFIQGQGGTPLRFLVLGSAIIMFALSALMLKVDSRMTASVFTDYYALALGLIAAGFFGVMNQRSVFSALFWTGLATQFLGGIFLLLAALAAMREFKSREISLATLTETVKVNGSLVGFGQQSPLGLIVRCGLAASAVAVATGLRLIFTEWFGPGLPTYATFYPTVMMVALFAGFVPGVAAVVLADFLAAYFILRPVGQLAIALPIDRLGLVIFTGMGLLMSTVAELYRRSRDRAAVFERKAALRESEERFRIVVENSRDGINMLDLKSGRYVFMSPSQEEMTGFIAEEWRDMTAAEVLDRVHPDDREISSTFLDRLMEGHDPGQRVEYRWMVKDGQYRWFSDSRSVIRNSQGQPVALVGISRDVTERKLSEERLQRMNEELETRVAERTQELANAMHYLEIEMNERVQAVEALREKERLLIQQSRQAAMGEMIGNIAHQWRQPLNVLGLLIQQMSIHHESGELGADFMEESVNTSMQLIKHMSRTIDDFRDYFKPDKDKAEFKATEAVAKTLQLVGENFKSQQISVEVIARDEPIIFGYQNEFSQVLLNILNNAKDALTARSTKFPRVTVTVSQAEDRAVVSIADNAGGIPPEILDKVFDPYFTTKGPQQGTGIGLFMSKSIIEKNMAGRLTAQNTADGAEFKIEV